MSKIDIDPRESEEEDDENNLKALASLQSPQSQLATLMNAKRCQIGKHNSVDQITVT